MKKWKLITAMAIGFLTVVSCGHDEYSIEEMVVVANRADGSISFIDASTNTEVAVVGIEGSEPMYVVYSGVNDRLYVGDRSKNEIHVINPDSKEVETSIVVGNGVFHMWADAHGNQLWVNNDIDKTTSVIDLSTNTVIQTIALTAKPHDVFVRENGTRAYISVFSETDAMDSVFMYSTSTFEKLAAVAVGKDPHLFHIAYCDQLFVPNQSGQVYILNGADLTETANISYPGAHGVYHSAVNGIVYVTNISGAELYAIDDNDGSALGAPEATSVDVPHNITVNYLGEKMYVTHSGATANKVTAYKINSEGDIALEETITVGTNPFGLAYYARWTE